MRQPCPPLTARAPVAIALTVMLVALWLLIHRYQGLAQDARIYAVQALARVNPELGHDLYLQNTSQDRYTLFSPLYAFVIGRLGLQAAARLLTLLFAAVFLTGAWKLAQNLLGKDDAWLSVGALIVTVGAYGSYSVFHFSEDYLTARSAAEAMVAVALAVYLGGCHRMALLIAASALLIHPLMALPGVLLLSLLKVGPRFAAAISIAGVSVAACLALTALTSPWARNLLPLMDCEWLGIVTERSQFLFLKFWSLRDWEVNLRPFASLALSAAVLANEKIRTLCIVAALVGASGLLVALVAGTVGPVALLVQGQAWRWVWIPVFIGTIMVPSTAIRLWHDERIGPVCAVLLAACWTSTASDAPALALPALALFLLRRRLTAIDPRLLRGTAMAMGLALLCWEAVAIVGPARGIGILAVGAGTNVPLMQRPGTIAASRYPVAIVVLAMWYWLRASESRWRPACLSITLGAACILLVPVAFGRPDRAGSMQEIREFADWQRVIPPSAAVYVLDGRDAAPFAWFTLQRPSYLSLDQSAGVVFSRETALEVRRRSLVLKPLMDEDWKLLSRNLSAQGGSPAVPRHTPLTASALLTICGDPQLSFLIAREDVGFDPLTHESPGPLMNWKLYDCAHVRTLTRSD